MPFPEQELLAQCKDARLAQLAVALERRGSGKLLQETLLVPETPDPRGGPDRSLAFVLLGTVQTLRSGRPILSILAALFSISMTCTMSGPIPEFTQVLCSATPTIRMP
jgi:hypothetical protein